jgi:hypothetical protein
VAVGFEKSLKILIEEGTITGTYMGISGIKRKAPPFFNKDMKMPLSQ